MKISTALRGYIYTIKSFEGSAGSEVTFEGPLNALLRQNLLPAMSYRPHTLEAKYKGMAEYVPIGTYCLIREDRHGGEKNTQDSYGAWVNKNFNNEVPNLPLWEDIVEENDSDVNEDSADELDSGSVYTQPAQYRTFSEIIGSLKTEEVLEKFA